MWRKVPDLQTRLSQTGASLCHYAIPLTLYYIVNELVQQATVIQVQTAISVVRIIICNKPFRSVFQLLRLCCKFKLLAQNYTIRII